MKPESIYGHVCYKLRNSLGGHGGIRVVRVSDDLGGSSSRGRGGVVAKSAVVHSRWCVKNLSEFRWVLMAVVCSSLQPLVGQSDALEDFRHLSSHPLDQVGSRNFFRGKIYDWLKKGILLMWINFLHSRRKLGAEPLVQRHILFIVLAAATRLTSGRILLFSSHVCMFFEWNCKSGEMWILLYNTHTYTCTIAMIWLCVKRTSNVHKDRT